MIPHCRLITALMRMQGALHQDNYCMVKKHKFILLGKLSYQEWSYSKTTRRFVLKDKKTKQVIEGLLPNVQSLGEGERDDVIEGGCASEKEESDGGDEGDAMGNVGSGLRDRVFEDDLLEAIVRSARPPEYKGWPKLTQVVYDRTTRENEHQRSANKKQNIQTKLKSNPSQTSSKASIPNAPAPTKKTDEPNLVMIKGKPEETKAMVNIVRDELIEIGFKKAVLMRMLETKLMETYKDLLEQERWKL
ncbi:hypothetical protein L1987_18597 [Smallanthus sonchifolius]|uniref:Uncharacterized protein n=1 Tax=Smallanthus sonchifolius TaxID=185202 RepID=A0ACB9J0I2_9ASTR|nr:hypothetical protein L1987_18597 [Smallanthus sonchifolius]